MTMRWRVLAILLVGLAPGIGQVGAATSGRDADWVDRAVEARSLASAEVPLDGLPWAASLPEAVALARQHHRLVYLLVDRGDVAKGRA